MLVVIGVDAFVGNLFQFGWRDEMGIRQELTARKGSALLVPS